MPCPQANAMDQLIWRVEHDQGEQLPQIVNTAYHVAKLELPFTSFPSLLSLQMKDGLAMGTSYNTDKACSR